MRAGSLPWLVRHELRVRWREFKGETSTSTLLLAGGAILVVVHVLLWFVARGLSGVLTHPLPPEAVYAAALVLLVLFPFGVAAGINHAVVALFDRGDLDLLGSSPLSSRTVFASRVLAVAVGVFVGLGLFVLPLASLGLLLGLPQLLGVVPMLVALALLCASLGMLITLLLVRLLGPRRARTAAQVLAALAGLLLFLASQVPGVLADRVDWQALFSQVAVYFEQGGLLATDSLLWLPARVLLLDPLGTLVALAGSLLVAWATVGTLHRAFARGVGLSEGRAAGAGSTRRADAGRDRVPAAVRFRSRGQLGTLLMKEWKLILRDPFLISQVLLQAVYFLPAIYFVFFADSSGLGGLDLGPAFAAILVVLSGMVTLGLARIAFVGEEAADLLAVSPVSDRLIRRGKMLAALVPVLALATPLGVGVALGNPVAGLLGTLGTAASCFAITLLRAWNPATTKRRDLFKNKGFGDPVMTVLEALVPMAMAAAVYLLATGSVYGLGLVGVAALVVALGYLRARGRGTLLAF